MKDILILPDGSQISSGAQVSVLSLTYTRKINAQQDFMPGCAAAASVEVKLLDETGSFTILPDTPIRYYRGECFMGTFYTEKASRPGKYTLAFTAYDAMAKAEQDLTQWLASLPDWPYTIARILQMTCEKCGIEADVQPVNGDYPVLQFARQVTGRQLIGWAAQACGAYAYIDENGVLKFGEFTQNPTPILPENRKSLTLADRPCAPIAQVAIGQDEQDLAAVYPGGEGECLHITGNPFLTAFSQQALTQCARRIYEKLAGFTYTPMETEVFVQEDVCWQPGQLVQVDGKVCAVFEMQLSGACAKLKSTGGPSRDSATARYTRDRVELLQGQMARVQEQLSGVTTEVGMVTTELQQLQVGGRNRILNSRTLDHESYYFSAGGATSDTATVTGNLLVITDADPENPQIQVQTDGDSLVCCGKNLLPYPYYYGATTTGGVTFTDNGDGTLTLNGTATDRVVYYLNFKDTAFYIPAGTVVTFSGTPSDGGNDRYFMQATDESSYPTESGKGITFTSVGGSYRFYIVVNAGTVLENVVFKPQLELGSRVTAFESCQGRTYTDLTQGVTACFPTTVLIARSPITATYHRRALLGRLQEKPPEGEDPVLRFAIDTLPQSFVMPGLLQPGQGYTLSFWAKGEGVLAVAGKEISLTEPWEKYVCTFTAESADLVLEFVTQGLFDLYHPQLEKGSVATDWSAAPEDDAQVLLTTREQLSSLQVASDKICAQVSQTETATRADLQLVQTEVQQLKKQTELSVTEEQLELAISRSLEQGSQKVTTRTGYTFDENGLTIATDRSDIRNRLDHTGMQVKRGEQVLLQADNTGVTARDVTVDNYLIIGTHARLEDYQSGRTACFWL